MTNTKPFFLYLQGPPKVALTEPKDFLTKRSKEFKLPESKQRFKIKLNNTIYIQAYDHLSCLGKAEISSFSTRQIRLSLFVDLPTF